MSRSENPCLSLAIDRLQAGESTLPLSQQAEQFAIWVLKAPYPGGYVFHNCAWPDRLAQTWNAWHEMFSLRGLPNVPQVHQATQPSPIVLPEPQAMVPGQTGNSIAARLMQHLGISLWQWLFHGSIQNTLAQSQGIAIGQNKPLRVRLEIRDPDLIALPWEIMQSQAGKQAISLSQQLLFSRTTSDVDPLPTLKLEQGLKILLVLGHDARSSEGVGLQLEQEAAALAKILEDRGQPDLLAQNFTQTVVCKVDVLLQPTPATLIKSLEANNYNILFYAGHGVTAPDGGLLFLRPDATINGTELAQILVRTQVTLCVINACWGAQPEQENQAILPRSSLAEVLLHHGVPAVLGMRDSISDEEALSFIQAFSQALAERKPIDQAVAVARQQLLTLYKFNQPAWTLPVLYMHPEFNGELIRPIEEGITEIPGLPPTKIGKRMFSAYLRSLGATTRSWPIKGARLRVGRSPENDLVIEEPGVSRKHAEIFRRDSVLDDNTPPTFFLRDDSSFGTLILGTNGWQKVHHQEVALQSGVQLKFGSTQGQALEFIIED